MPSEPTSHTKTVWQVVRAAADNDAAKLDELLRAYRPMLVAHLAVSRGVPHPEAEDLAQEFILRKLLEGDLLRRADPGQGKFRSLLLSALDNFHVSHLRAQAAEKRAPGRAGPLPEEHPAPEGRTVEAAWALDALGEAVLRLRDGSHKAKRPDLWGLFEGRELAAVFGVAPASFEELARRWRFATAKQAANAHATACRRFGRLLTAVLGERGEGAADEDRADLVRGLRDAGPELLSALRALLWGRVPEISSAVGGGRFDPARLTALLDPPPGPPDRGALLRQLLSSPVPFDLGDVDPRLLERLPELAGQSGLLARSLGDVLRHPSPGAELLDVVKQFAKDNRVNPDSPLPEPVSTFVYYLSLAAALVRHGARISRLDDAGLRDGIGWALAQPWAGDEWRGLLGDAVKALS